MHVAPYAIDITSIEAEKADDNNVTIMWKVCNYIKNTGVHIVTSHFMQQPEIDSCSVLAIKHYDVTIYSDEGEIISSGITDVNSITISIKHNMNDYSNTAFTVNVTVTVVDIGGQRSTTTSVTVIINATHCQNTNSSKYATIYVRSYNYSNR